MPIYEYKCTKGHVFDVMQGFSDDPVKRCTECGAAVKRVLHAPAVHFKGSGFHNTDYGTRRRQREGKENEGSSSSESSANSSSSSSDGQSSDGKKSDSSPSTAKASSSSSSSD
jgi:putative FmdB family regulatory protein